MSNRPSELEEDLRDVTPGHCRALAPRHTKHISIWCFALLILVILGVYLISSLNIPQAAPGQDQVAPGRAIGQ
jgi:hypothetical protein